MKSVNWLHKIVVPNRMDLEYNVLAKQTIVSFVPIHATIATTEIWWIVQIWYIYQERVGMGMQRQNWNEKIAPVTRKLLKDQEKEKIIT